jgi:hypothetical protein
MYRSMDGNADKLDGKLMCYYCRHEFPIPETANWYHAQVVCPNCSRSNTRDHFRASPNDPLRNRLGWPYDDPTVPYDC